MTAGASFLTNEKLKSQMERTAACILSNVTEGFQSRTKVSIRQYFVRAEGFLQELRAEFFEALNSGCLSEEQFAALQEQCEKCRAQVSGYMASL